MDFLSNLAKGGEPKSSGDEKGSDLLGSAKIVTEAAQAQFGGQSDKYDKGKAADAAADLLDAASKYGKLDDSQGVGKYVEQAETYLRQYDTTPNKPSADEPAKASEPSDEPKKATDAAADEIAKKVEESTIDDSKKIVDEAPKPEKTESTEATDYVKVAEGFLSKASGDGEKKEGESGGGGYGDVLKTAGSFFK